MQGQFAELSVLGIGEAPISITSSPFRKEYLEFTIRGAGEVTKAISEMNPGDIFHLRGPFGNNFPLEEARGKNLYFIAGGIGLPPLRSLINMVFNARDQFGKITILYGAKTADEFCFKDELQEWQNIDDTHVHLTVDSATDGWIGNVGLVTELWNDARIDADNSMAFVCGPPIMIKFVTRKLLDESGFTPSEIIMTLERYMKCGVGKCGHCNIGSKFVCMDGPVFSLEEVLAFPNHENVF
jgi:NAD(P)H-flavin reductase